MKRRARHRTVRTRVASRRPRPHVARLRTTSGFRPIPAGLQLGMSCAHHDCGAALELVTAGAHSPLDTRAIVRCTECQDEWLVVVQLWRPNEKQRGGTPRMTEARRASAIRAREAYKAKRQAAAA